MNLFLPPAKIKRNISITIQLLMYRLDFSKIALGRIRLSEQKTLKLEFGVLNASRVQLSNLYYVQLLLKSVLTSFRILYDYIWPVKRFGKKKWIVYTHFFHCYKLSVFLFYLPKVTTISVAWDVGAT